jgi:tetratricopeptide (TPR) repeat protein
MLHHHRTSSRIRMSALAALAALMAAGPAYAQKKEAPQKGAPTADELAKGKEHFAKGRKLFDKKNYKGAVLEFKESYKLTRNALLLYNIGFTLDQMGDKPMALFYYQKYLQLAPETDGNRQAAEGRIPVLELEIEEATVMGGESAGPTRGKDRVPDSAKEKEKEAAPAAPTVEKFQHMVIDEAPPGRAIDVSAFIPANRKWTVILYYRAAGEGAFTRAEMKPRYNELVARIPAAKTVGASVQYYIEVKDAKGKVVDRSGRQTSPHLVFLDKSAKAHYYSDMGDESAAPITASDDDDVAATGGGMATSSDGPRGDGWMDAGSSKFTKLKWGATGAAAGLLALSTTFYLLSSKASSDLEDEARSSSDPVECGGVPPCRTFSEKQQALEGKGQRFETFANVSLGIGAAAAIGAGVLWYLDIRDARKRRKAREESRPGDDEPNLSAVPVVGDGFVGGAAAVRF